MRHWSWIVFVALCCACVSQPIYRSGSAPSPGASTAKSSARSANPPVPSPVVVPRKTAHPVDTKKINTRKAYQIGVASYYGKKFHGRKTANGETFNMYKLTAAHRVLPLGTRVRVTHLENGRWVELKVNDRGPFYRRSYYRLVVCRGPGPEMVKSGKAKVMIEIIEAVD